MERKPRLARAHLELGLLYEKREEPDYVAAIYHYQRYIELRPQAEKRELIEGLIRQAQIAFAASLPDRPSAAVEEVAMLKKEIEMLKARLAERKGLDPPKTTPAKSVLASSKKRRTTPRVASAEPSAQLYEVQRGDTLSSIAAKVYQDPNKWTVIYEANRKHLASPEQLRLGQTMIIPHL